MRIASDSSPLRRDGPAPSEFDEGGERTVGIHRFVQQPLELQTVHDGRQQDSGVLGVDGEVFTRGFGRRQFGRELTTDARVAVDEELMRGMVSTHRLTGDGREHLGDGGVFEDLVQQGDKRVEQVHAVHILLLGDVLPVTLLQYGDEQLVLGREVVTKTGEGDARLFRDAAHRGSAVAELSEHAACCGEDVVPLHGRFRVGPPRLSGCHSDHCTTGIPKMLHVSCFRSTVRSSTLNDVNGARSIVTIPDIERPMAALPESWIGVNFWSRVGGPFMWRDFDDAVVLDELRTLAEHSLTVTRSFFFWPDFHPEPYTIDDTLCEAFARFLDLHSETGLTTIPTFIVGHMSGQNWDPAWRNGRDLYTDVWMVGRQAWFIQQMVQRFSGHPAVAGWLVSNEMPLYGGGGGLMGPVEPVDGAAVRAWSELMVAAAKGAGATQPVSLGDGAWGLEVMGQDNGFQLTWSAPLTDWIGPHSYHMNDDPVRQNLIPAFNSELCAPYGKPVVMEEFGVTSEFAADDNAADYYRQVLHSTLAAGVTGWLGWNNTDFDLDSQEPYNHRPFELHFGLTTPDGTPKPALRELGSFAEAVREHGLAQASRARTRTGLVLSGYFDGEFPFWGPEESAALRDSLLEGYIAARLADLAPAIVRDDANVPALPLLMVPSAKAITTPGARALAAAARKGSTVWVSFSCGETLNQRGWWWPGVDQTFGVRHASRYGLSEPVVGDAVTLRFEEAFGDLAAGDELVLPVGGSGIGRAYFPVEATEARVVARDAAGRPAILVHETGAGRLVLCTYPVELFTARTGFVDRSDLVRLYRALAHIADAAGPVQVSALDVYGDLLHGQDGTSTIVLVSEADEPRDVTVHIDGRTDFAASLAPFGAAIIPVASVAPAL